MPSRANQGQVVLSAKEPAETVFSRQATLLLHLAAAGILACLMLAAVPRVALAREGCTTAVISGAATVDGRPLVWKNRDTSYRDNALAILRGPEFRFLALINAGDSTQVWAGVNEAGLAIMNAEALDTEGDSVDTEGFFMRRVLGSCATVDEVESLLVRTNRTGRGTKSNFGVIDARGGACYFEAGNHTYARYDAEKTPRGWLVRTNFAETGNGRGAGWFRYVRAKELVGNLARTGRLSVSSLLWTVARDLTSPWGNPRPLPFAGKFDGAPAGWVQTRWSINRYRTASCNLFVGVRPGEDPLLVTYWVILGEPIFGAALPVWLAAGEVPEALAGHPFSRLNRQIQSLENRAYADSARPAWFDTRRLAGPNSGVLEELHAFEERLVSRVEEKLREMRTGGAQVDSLRAIQRQAADELRVLLEKLGAAE